MSRILLSLLSTIALEMLAHCSNNMICFGISFWSNAGWRKSERAFSPVHQREVICKSDSETAVGVLKHSAADRAFCSIEVSGYLKWKGRIAIELRYQARRFQKRWGIEWNGIESMRVEGEAERGGEQDWGEEKKRWWSGGRSIRNTVL